MSRPTVVEVAERAGVSIASVSRVLNGKTARTETVRAVREAVDELGYVPAGTGRALRLGRPMQIAFAVDDVANPVYTQMMSGVEEGIHDADARLVLSSIGHDPDDLIAFVRGLDRGYADGLIISPLVRDSALLRCLREAPIPVVVIGRLTDHDGLDCVRTDSTAAVHQAYRHLVTTGATRIAFVNGPGDTLPGQARARGFAEAEEQADRRGPTVEQNAFTVAAGEEALARLFAGPVRTHPDAVLAANDLLALGVIRAALTAGRPVPHSLLVAGIDDIEFARIFSPTLTTVSLGAHRRGRLAAELLLGRVESPRRDAQQITVPVELKVRESTRYPRVSSTAARAGRGGARTRR